MFKHHRKNPPSRKPTAAGNQAGRPEPSIISIAGASSDQKLAAIITPAANPSIPSSIFLFMVLKKTTALAPKAVTNQVKHPATSACTTGLRSANRPRTTLLS